MSTVPELFLSYVDRNPEDISTHALRKTGWESLSRAESLVKVAVSGNSKFFLGTDTAPHFREDKESACGCAGILLPG